MKLSQKWFAEVWLNRRQFTAEGKTEEEAKTKLINHIKEMVLVLEEQLKVEQKTIQDMKDYLENIRILN